MTPEDASMPCRLPSYIPLLSMPRSTPEAITIEYTNHRGETAYRDIVPEKLRYGRSPFHEGEQWFLEGKDIFKQADRSFACCDIHYWGTLGSRRLEPAAVAKAVTSLWLAIVGLLLAALIASNLWWLSR